MRLVIVHGYSLLRTQLNNDYFHDIFDEAFKFEVPLEGHRKLLHLARDSTERDLAH